MASTFLAPQPLPSPLLSHSPLPCDVTGKSRSGRIGSRPRTAPSKSSEMTWQVQQDQQQPPLPSFPKRLGLGALLTRRPSTSSGTVKSTASGLLSRQMGHRSETPTPSAPLLSATQASDFVNSKVLETSTEGEHLLAGLRHKGATMVQGVRYALNTALTQLASVECPGENSSPAQVTSDPANTTMYRRQSGVPIASSRIGDASSAFPWTPLSPPVISPCNWPSRSRTCNSSSPASSNRSLLSPAAHSVSQHGPKHRRPATAAAASSSPSSASTLSPWAPTSLPASPLSSASSTDRRAGSTSGQSSTPCQTSNNAGRQQEALQQCGQDQDFWVDEDGQMVFRILPLHAPHAHSDADAGLEQQKHGAYAQPEYVDR